MNDGQRLLWAILDEPEVDLHRLVYADWLDENGQGERAEFIRVQVELANWKPWKGDQVVEEIARSDRLCSTAAMMVLSWQEAEHNERHKNLKQHELALQRAGSKWWSNYGPGDVFTVTEWKRGFATEVRCTLADWLTHGESIMAQHPVERVVTERKAHTDFGLNCNPSWFCPGIGASWASSDAEDLPEEVWNKLTGYYDVCSGWKSYDTEQAALDALNAVLVGEWRKLEQGSRKETVSWR